MHTGVTRRPSRLARRCAAVVAGRRAGVLLGCTAPGVRVPSRGALDLRARAVCMTAPPSLASRLDAYEKEYSATGGEGADFSTEDFSEVLGARHEARPRSRTRVAAAAT